MFLPRYSNPTKGSKVPTCGRCSLPELYVLVENFNEEKKSNLLKIHGISHKEAQKLLTKNLNVMSFISGTGTKREDPQPVFTCNVVKKEEMPESMADILHHSLLLNAASPVERFSRSQQRLSQSGIPPPKHTFPYDIITDDHSAVSWSTFWKKIQATRILSRSHSSTPRPQPVILEDKVPRYFLADPG
ncbi:uncharacterized protein C9orf153 homolog isoform X2 [Castor canadensis]|uniref:Uncharacterized protein C9orf153 homolog isoform X2 n=1 Tax=Castor canadensis TaxID=51338 RepID=A0AC58KTV7_CASCN